ncbi:uncharacterized protein LOC122280450 [Carya illinoinensis]|uniref:uncharacterized protein LOC122280450 n=1 Tax=Carya illinoinensis TaxID=32201 RepID=UPI001C71DCBB|nr:uncharacterized protein LOC122280450 [Carya illinoinensis]
MTELSDNTIELREELMVSPMCDHNPTFRRARFLKPSAFSIKGPIFELPSLSPSSLPPTFEPSKWPLKVRFNGWQNPPRKWKSWVDSMCPKYQSLWKKAGIFEAIMNSTYEIDMNHDIVIAIAERWCSKTNTCIFPWAEATLTLEDIMVLGGFSVLGESVYSPVETQELKEIEAKLMQARVEALRSKARKACPGVWMKMFMNTESEVEHEVFLVFWLSISFLPNSRWINKDFFPIAIHLAKGTRIALAPAVLASIYSDLSLLKEAIVALDKDVVEVTFRSPYHLVQLWVWERFRSLQPKPNLIICGDPVFARWHRVRSVKDKNVRSALDSARESFLWRPYVSYTFRLNCRKLYGEKEIWVPVNAKLDEEIEAWVRYFRVSELVGLGCIEHYFPHRVAMQFGMDQDLPGCVAKCSKDHKIAWNNYSKRPSDVTLYVPSRLCEGEVTTRYLNWWKQSISGQALRVPTGKDGDVLPGFSPKFNKVKAEDSVNIYKPTVPKQVAQASIGNKGDNDADVPPGFSPKCNKVEVEKSIKEDKSAGGEMRSYGMHDSLGRRADGVDEPFLGQSQSFSVTDGAVKKTESMMRAGENIKVEDAVKGLERDIDGPGESKAESLVYNRVSIHGKEGEGGSYTHEIPGRELEARITRLERAIAELKAARSS